MALRHRRILDRVTARLSYWIGLAEMEFTNDLERLMREDGVSRSELARRIHSSPAFVSKALAGNANFTLKTMAKLARAFGAVLHVRLAREGEILEIKSPQTAMGTALVEMDYSSDLYFADEEAGEGIGPLGRRALSETSQPQQFLH